MRRMSVQLLHICISVDNVLVNVWWCQHWCMSYVTITGKGKGRRKWASTSARLYQTTQCLWNCLSILLSAEQWNWYSFSWNIRLKLHSCQLRISLLENEVMCTYELKELLVYYFCKLKQNMYNFHSLLLLSQVYDTFSAFLQLSLSCVLSFFITVPLEMMDRSYTLLHKPYKITYDIFQHQ